MGVVVSCHTGYVPIHDFVQTELQHLGCDVVWVDVDGGGVVFVLPVGF